MITIKYLNHTIYLLMTSTDFDDCENNNYIIEQVDDDYYFVYFMKDNIAVQINDFYGLDLAVECVKLKVEDETFNKI